jgi:hypothetical protein
MHTCTCKQKVTFGNLQRLSLFNVSGLQHITLGNTSEIHLLGDYDYTQFVVQNSKIAASKIHLGKMNPSTVWNTLKRFAHYVPNIVDLSIEYERYDMKIMRGISFEPFKNLSKLYLGGPGLSDELIDMNKLSFKIKNVTIRMNGNTINKLYDYIKNNSIYSLLTQ